MSWKMELHGTPLSRLAKASITLDVLLGIGALAGGFVLIVAPRGEILPLPVSALEGSPFDTYLWPGVFLFTVLGLGPSWRLGWPGAGIHSPPLGRSPREWRS